MKLNKAIGHTVLTVFISSFFISVILLIAMGLEEGIGIALFIAVVASFICFIGCLIIAVPTYKYFKSHNMNNWMAYSLVGFIMPPTLFFGLVLLGSGGMDKSVIIFSMIMGGFGFLSMTVFWRRMHHTFELEATSVMEVKNES